MPGHFGDFRATGDVIDPVFGRIRDHIEDECLMAPCDRILLAFSGGVDSTVLFHFLRQYLNEPSQLILVYFDHQLRGQESTSRERNWVKDLGREWGVETRVRRLPIAAFARSRGVSIEAAGHLLRRTLLRHLARLNGISIVVTGHHLDDHIETALMQWVRGAQRGWRGMRSKSDWGRDVVLVRPMKTVSKAAIVSLANTQSWAHLTDESNSDLRYRRNVIRHEVRPHLAALNPNWNGTMAATLQFVGSLVASKESALRSQFSRLTWNAIGVSGALLDLATDPASFTHLLQMVFEEHGRLYPRPGDFGFPRTKLPRQSKLISRAQIAPLMHAVKMGSGAGDLAGWRYRVRDARITLHRNPPTEGSTYRVISLPVEAAIAFSIPELGASVTLEWCAPPDDFCFDPTIVLLSLESVSPGPLIVRTRQTNDRFYPFGAEAERNLARWMIRRKVASHMDASITAQEIGFSKQNMPLFFMSNQLLWAPCLGISELVRVARSSQRVLKITLIKESKC